MQQPRQAQEDPLNLRSLPLVDPPSDDWPKIEAALSGRARRRRMLGLATAAAAMITLMIGLVFRLPILTPWEEPALIVQEPAVNETPAVESADPASSAVALDSLVALSQELEDRLRIYRYEVGDMPADSLVYQVELQDLVVQVDEELSMYPDSQELWQQRIALLLDLTRLYENQLRRDYHLMASL